jgi:hypothetical protein
MFSKNWLVIKDDAKKTYEVCGKETNTNSFMNKVHGMQRLGMNVSCTTPPVTNHTSSKELVKIQDYKKEDGLYDRLSQEYQVLTMKDFHD